MVGIKNRNIVLCILFSILTCGIYAFYWTYVISNDSRLLAGDEPGAGLDIILDIITCGIFGFVVVYKSSKRMYEVDLYHKGRASDDSTLVTLLYALMAIASLAILQTKINAYAEVDGQYQ